MRLIFRLMMVFLTSSVLVISSLPYNCEAYPFKFQGYLRDESGVPIPLATVHITGEIYNMTTQDLSPQTWTTTTDEYGKYTVWIAANEPGGLFLNSTATLSYQVDETVSSTTVVVTGLSAWGNITYREETGLLDTLTTPFGILLIVIVITTIIFVFFMLRSEKKEDIEENANEKPRRVERRRGRK